MHARGDGWSGGNPSVVPTGDHPRRERKLLHQRERGVSAREQGKHLWEAVNQGRRVIELADHKARYALVVMGVVNAGLLILVTRSSHFIPLVPAHIRPLLSLLIIPFLLVSLVFLVDSYNSLRPRPPLPIMEQSAPASVNSGRLLFWDRVLAASLLEYQHAWRKVEQGELNDELAAMAYALAQGIRAKYRALHRLFIELLIIILLAALILGVPLYYGFMQEGWTGAAAP
jgi:hypothetical protein